MTDATHHDGSTPTTGLAGAETAERTGRRPDSLADIRETYADQAETVARMRWLDRLLVGRYRRRLFERATGRVLDVACGTGTNAEYVPESAEYVGVDISPEMLREADEELRRLGRAGTLAEMDAQALAFPDDSFETVISSLSTCTFPDPVAALDEMNRVCEPDGQVLLLEHGRSSVELFGRFQDWRADAHYEKHSCRWNQEPLALVSQSALALRESSTRLFGVITAIRAEPG
ncbi:class I SAM-dependent methyltransferase [Halosimplex amylolyticum]|uniref:class I SAM-dependent methyltransferase n=1 Tax=Halosimplex amylolyticum TaxID=3396616 RepID=UPI003F547CB1